jgi:hypothetical protein
MKLIQILVFILIVVPNGYCNESFCADSKKKSRKGIYLGDPCLKIEYFYNSKHNIHLASGVYSIGDFFEDIWYFNVGFDFGWKNKDVVMAPTLNVEYHHMGNSRILPCARLQIWTPFNRTKRCLKLSPSAGISLFSFAYVLVGYNFDLTPDTFSNITGFQITTGINIPFP